MAASLHRKYEFRCPLHGFVQLNDWEREIISHPAYQRLRRIRQLAWTDQVYPGAMHTRFEHSLGVMHVATAMYDAVSQSSHGILVDELGFDDAGIQRERIVVRLTALMHDLGHSPFSHAAEDLFPFLAEGERRYVHEEYSSAIIRLKLRDVIENHPLNRNYKVTAEEIACLLEGNPAAGRALVWRDLVTGQMDADRVDYLLRDSLHSGVQYGKFDWRRLIGCLTLVPAETSGSYRLGVTEGGLHAAESLVLARYFMFTQVYFHKTRVAYDHHLQSALTNILPGGVFPKPTNEELDSYLKWDDWRVLGRLADGEGGEHGKRLSGRDHFREIYHTAETPKKGDIMRFDRICRELGELLQYKTSADKSWYKVGDPDIPIQSENPSNGVTPLSQLSSVVNGLKPIGKRLVYVAFEDKDQAREIVKKQEAKR
jgi:HD superfamily phosphohydrolase